MCIRDSISGMANTDTMAISARLAASGGTLYLNTDGSEPIVNVPPNSLDLGNTLELLPDSLSTYTWKSTDSDGNLTFYSFVEESTDGQNMVSGKIYLEADLVVL